MDEIQRKTAIKHGLLHDQGKMVLPPGAEVYWTLLKDAEKRLEIYQERAAAEIRSLYELLQRHQQEVQDFNDAANALLTRGDGV